MTGTLVTWNRSTGRSSAHILKCTLLLKSLPRKLTKFKLASLSMSPELNKIANMCKKGQNPINYQERGQTAKKVSVWYRLWQGKRAAVTTTAHRNHWSHRSHWKVEMIIAIKHAIFRLDSGSNTPQRTCSTSRHVAMATVFLGGKTKSNGKCVFTTGFKRKQHNVEYELVDVPTILAWKMCEELNLVKWIHQVTFQASVNQAETALE